MLGIIAVEEAAWSSSEGAELEIRRSRVHFALWPLAGVVSR